MHLKKQLTGLFATVALLSVSLQLQANIEAQEYEYVVEDTTFSGYLAYNSRLQESRGTVIIIHDWDGPNAYEYSRAHQLAAKGYTAFAIDLYGKDRQPTSMEENRQRSRELYNDRDLFRQRLMGALNQVPDLPHGSDQIVVMGYCFGGAAVLEMARAGAQVNGFVSFHGGLDLPEGQNYNQVQAPILVLHGSADPVSDMQDLANLMEQLQEAEIPHHAQIYGGARHSFSVHSSGDYELQADQASWAALLNFLERQL